MQCNALKKDGERCRVINKTVSYTFENKNIYLCGIHIRVFKNNNLKIYIDKNVIKNTNSKNVNVKKEILNLEEQNNSKNNISKKININNLNKIEKMTNKDNNNKEYEKIVEKIEHLNIVKECYTDDDLSTIKEKYRLLKYKITNFLFSYINRDEKKNINNIKEYVFNLFYNELYIKNTNNEKIVFDTIIQNINFSSNKEFNEIKNRLEKLINLANNFFISFNSVIKKHKVKILFDYFLKNKIYDDNIMYTDNNSIPQKITKCIYPAILYLYEDNNKKEYDVLEKALVITD